MKRFIAQRYSQPAVVVSVSLIVFLLSRPGTLGYDLTNLNNFPDPDTDAMNQDYFSSLPYDVLRQVCASASSDPNFRAPLDGLSRSTKHLRDISLPDVFRNVLIRGRWDFASSRLKAMEECHAILSCVKYLDPVSNVFTNGLLTRLQGLKIRYLRRERSNTSTKIYAIRAGQST